MKKLTFVIAVVSSFQLIISSKVFADNAPRIIENSTTEVLQKTLLNKSNYAIGMSVGRMPPNTAKPWKTHQAPEIYF